MNGWVNNREAGDLRRYLAHYDVIVMEPRICDGLSCLQTHPTLIKPLTKVEIRLQEGYLQHQSRESIVAPNPQMLVIFTEGCTRYCVNLPMH